MPCVHGVEYSKCVTIQCFKKQLELLIKSEQAMRSRHQNLYGIEDAERKACHRLDAFNVVLSFLPE